MVIWLRLIIAFVIACHGLVYIIYGYMIPGKIKEWNGTSWILGSSVKGDRLKKLMLILHVAAGIGTIACAVAIAIAPLISGLWPPLAIIGASIGIIGFIMFWDGQVRFLVQEGLIGAAISLAILLTAVLFPTAFN
jgi:hypothetical protein